MEELVVKLIFNGRKKLFKPVNFRSEFIFIFQPSFSELPLNKIRVFTIIRNKIDCFTSHQDNFY